MHQFEFRVKATGKQGDPLVRMSLNGEIFHDGRWSGDDVVKTYNLKLSDSNHLEIHHYGKRFGENRCWDQYEFVLREIWFDDVPISKIWKCGNKEYHHNGEIITDEIGPVEMVFGFNGIFSLDFTAPIYDWIIDKRKIIITPDKKKISSLDYYNREYTNHSEIRKMFARIDEALTRL